MEQEIQAAEEDEEIERLQKKLDMFIDEYQSVPVYAKPLDKDRRHNVMVIGPPRSGKSRFVKKIAYD